MSGGAISNLGMRMILTRMWKPIGVTVPSEPSVFMIGTGMTDVEYTDTALETPITNWHSSTNIKKFVTGYPILDATNLEIEVKGLVASTEANGNLISEAGFFNTDGTPVMESRHVLRTAISKTDFDNVIFICKQRLRR